MTYRTQNMSLPSHKEMMRREQESPGYLNELFEREAELVIQSAPKENQHKLECIDNGCKLRRQASKNNIDSMIKAQKEMWKIFGQLKDALNNPVGNND